MKWNKNRQFSVRIDPTVVSVIPLLILRIVTKLGNFKLQSNEKIIILINIINQVAWHSAIFLIPKHKRICSFFKKMRYRFLFGHSSRNCWSTTFFLIVGGDSLCMDVLMVIQGKSCIWHAVEITKQKLYLHFFLQWVAAHGLPSRIRGDHGVENVEVAWYMFNHPSRGPDQGSYITGPSVHNARIERLWRDVFVSCLYIYYSVFQHLEVSGYLDLSDNIHMFCLHYIYKPRINAHLKNFTGSWNNHPIRTAGNRTPTQLWTSGLLQAARSSDYAARELQDQYYYLR